MVPPIRPPWNPSQAYGGGAANPPSNNLWIGNVPPDVSELDLKSLFEKFGKIDSVTTYSSRNSAFVQFKETEEATSAKLGLQGSFFRGFPLKIAFAKPTKPCKSLWVAGISHSVSKEELEDEFLKFGKIQDFRFLRDRNTAYIDYVALEDATQAMKTMNGKRIGGVHIRVDYLRSQTSKRELGPDTRESQFFGRNMWMGHDCLNSYSDPGLAGAKRKNQLIPAGSQYRDAPLSKVLWIKCPPHAVIEEDMLHNALILFGEIERIKTFRDKNHAFVEFRSVEEARFAKEGLQGKLFNDPRILMEYFNGEFSGGRSQVSEYAFNPGLGNNSGHPPSLGMRGPELHVRPPLGHYSTFDPSVHGPEFIDLAAGHKLQNPSPKTLIGGPSWKSISPPPGIVASPSAGFNVPNRPASGTWDVLDASELQTDAKRSRYESELPSERTGLDEPYGLPFVRSSEGFGSLRRGMRGGHGKHQADSGCIWRGLIAKGGTPICHARCVSVGEGLAADIPDVVNCSARTGLDMLSKHYEDATGFDLVFFLPDSEEDFASYTEFLRYLGSKDRAGVAKFDDDTTLFLVPPSDFLSKVLKVSGPERLYGVVLKFQVDPNIAAINPRLVNPQHAGPQKSSVLQTGRGSSQSEERISPLDNSRVLHEDPKMPPNAPKPTGSFSAHSVPPTAVAAKAGLTLTPELIATLTSLLPSNDAASALRNASLPQTSLAANSQVASGPDNMAKWKHEQAVDPNRQLVQHLGNQINPQLQHLQAAQAATSHYEQTYNPDSQMNDQTTSVATRGAAASKPMAPVIPLQGGKLSLAPEISWYLQGFSQDVLKSRGMDNGNDGQTLYNPSIVQQPAYPVASSNQLNGVSQPQQFVPLPSEVQAPHQSQPPQAAETEADKNERYKTTLLFAANLLSQIHQPLGNQPGHGTGSQ